MGKREEKGYIFSIYKEDFYPYLRGSLNLKTDNTGKIGITDFVTDHV